MLASVLIIAISTVLLAYWFRYSCLLLVRNQAERATEVAGAEQMDAVRVRANLQSGTLPDAIEKSLNRDYQVLSYLLEHSAGLRLNSLEDRMLVLDFKLMRGWYRLTRVAAPQQATDALAEMASVLAILTSRVARPPDLPEQA